ncbi:hypothetical protein GCM10010052_32600 [Paenarthrobacter histidinolovorans]|nr:hypothetical protein GCM10010052_32600 [Paenarthrobacter histidinolovorans]
MSLRWARGDGKDKNGGAKGQAGAEEASSGEFHWMFCNSAVRPGAAGWRSRSVASARSAAGH